jgi:hypothetical protein
MIAASCPTPLTITCPEPECLERMGFKAANAREHGAAALIVVPDYRHDDILWQPRYGLPWCYPDCGIEPELLDPTFPAVIVRQSVAEAVIPDLEERADTIDAALAPSSLATGVTADIDVAFRIGTPLDNVLARIDGADPELGQEAVIIGANVDTFDAAFSSYDFLGADDNASGVAAVLELARTFDCLAEGGEEPARTIVFAVWKRTESTRDGSLFYASAPTWPLEDTIAYFNPAGVGGGDGTGVDIGSADSPGNEWIPILMRESAAEMGFPYDVTTECDSCWSDHTTFLDVGIPAVMVGAIGDHSYVHTPDDTIDVIDVDVLEVSLSMLWAALRPLSLGTEDQYTGE